MKNITEARHEFLATALLELRELAPSGSEEMAIIDEALGKVGLTPWKGRGIVRTIDEEFTHCAYVAPWSQSHSAFVKAVNVVRCTATVTRLIMTSR